MSQKIPRIEIVAVGSELLTSHFQDTDSPYIVTQLEKLGLTPAFRTILSDEEKILRQGLQDALQRSELCFIIGGLGPTEDDRTREILASLLKKKLIFHEEILTSIRQRFARRGLTMPPSNLKQAYVIEGSQILPNHHGTAPGQWLEERQKIIVLLPGPPQELQPMFATYVRPRLERWRIYQVYQARLKLTGITESQIEEKIKDLYPSSGQPQLTTLAYPGQIEILISAQSQNSLEEAQEKVNQMVDKLRSRLGAYIFTTQGEALEEVVGQLLRQRGETLAVAESCTGGLLGHRLTNIPGSSDYFRLGTVVYSNEAKIKLLGVSPETLAKYGAVSQEVAREMALGLQKLAGTTHTLAITGIAGPGGGTPSKPVGLVYTARAGEDGCQVIKNQFLGARELVKFQSSQKALEMLWRYLTQLQE